MTGDATAADDLLQRARAAYLDTATPAPPGLVETAMRTVRSDLRPGRRIALPAVSTGSAARGFATDVAVANALRLALDDEPAVVVRRCRVVPGRGAVGVGLTVAISYPHWDRHGDDVVRARVVAAARDLFGVSVEAVDIDIVDLTVDPTAGGVDA